MDKEALKEFKEKFDAMPTEDKLKVALVAVGQLKQELDTVSLATAANAVGGKATIEILGDINQRLRVLEKAAGITPPKPNMTGLMDELNAMRATLRKADQN